MTDKKDSVPKNKYTPDWFVQGVLTKIGDAFDKLTGRGWKPANSLATSGLIERMKKLLDAEARDAGNAVSGARFVPHNIKLKMQWDKFSTDATDSLKKLENELLVAAVDHINDNRYHTYAPLKVEVKPDYFTEGVKLWASFDEFAGEDDAEEAEMKVTVPGLKVGEFIPVPAPEPEPEPETIVAEYAIGGRRAAKELKFTKGKRLSVGRTKESNLMLDDESVSKNHATLMLNNEDVLLVADTGSTNGTFVAGERIAYGRAFAVGETGTVKFGEVAVFFRRVPRPVDFVVEEDVNKLVIPANAQTENRQSADLKVPVDNSQNAQIQNKTMLTGKIENRQTVSEIKNTRETVNEPAQTEQIINLNLADDGKS